MSSRAVLVIVGMMIGETGLSGATITTTILAESFDFSTNTHGGLGIVTGGDFYYIPPICPIFLPCPPVGPEEFFANNVGQQGLQDLGPIPLTSITTIPTSGYTQFGVPATIGHSYVSLAQVGEPGFFIFFTVTAKTSESVTIDWIYSNTAPGGCPPHTVHGHISTTPSTHSPGSHAHHGQHGHSVSGCFPPHQGVFHLTPEPELGLSGAGAEEPPSFVAALNQDGNAGPAKRGTVLQLFGSARGVFVGDQHDQPAEGFTPPEAGSPLYFTTSLPQVRIGGAHARVLFSGLSPGLTGVWQINVLVPEDAPRGRIPVTINYEGDELKGIVAVVE